MIQAYEKGVELVLSQHFSTREFDCPCKKCDHTLIDDDLVLRLQKLREIVGHPVVINSGFRCLDHQKELAELGYPTAQGISPHSEGMAADIRVKHFTGAELEKFAREAGFEAVGVARTWIHADTRGGKVRSWKYF